MKKTFFITITFFISILNTTQGSVHISHISHSSHSSHSSHLSHSHSLRSFHSMNDFHSLLLSPAPEGKNVRILTIDGGGARGVIPAYMLTRLEERVEKPVAEMFHMVMGTSTGGIQALGLTVSNPKDRSIPLHPASKLLSIYSNESSQFFVKKAFSFGGAFKTKYKSTSIYNKLKAIFGEALFSDSLIDTLVTGYDIERSEPKIFKSYKAVADPLYNFFDYDLARGTSAAPTYFKSAKIKSQAKESGEIREHVLIDGGVFANDPTLCAFTEAKKIYPFAENFTVVSLGTGRAQNPILYEDSQSLKGYNWATKFPDVSLDSSAMAVHYGMSIFANTDPAVKYYRFQPTLEGGISSMDDTSPETIRRWIYHAETMTQSQDFQMLVRDLSPPKTDRGLLIEPRITIGSGSEPRIMASSSSEE